MIQGRNLAVALFLVACGPDGELDTAGSSAALEPRVSCAATQAQADALPGVYPNQLTGREELVEVALLAPHHCELRRHGPFVAMAASALDASSTAGVSATEVVLRDIDGDGTRDAVAAFSAAALRSAGLLGGATTRLRVSVGARNGSTLLAGEDRLFERDRPLVVLPSPDGRNDVGTTQLLVVDHARPDGDGAGRKLLLRLWYPAEHSELQPAEYFLDRRAAGANALAQGLPPDVFEPVHAWSQLGARPSGWRPRTTLLLSTGAGSALEFNATLAEDLASHGYLVIGIAHPDGSGIVVYPDGSVSPPPGAIDVDANRRWATDLKFIVQWLQERGRRIRWPFAGVADAALALVDRGRIGALGHSFGGAAAVWAAAESPAVRASANLDGRFWGDEGPSSPVLLMLSEGHRSVDPTIDAFLARAVGSVYTVDVRGSGHNNYGDVALLVNALLLDPTIPPEVIEQMRAALGIGSMDALRGFAIRNAYVRAFFDATLSARPSPLLSGDTAQFPEVTFGAQ
jgi:predicted dienelactone hydrolase